MNKINSYLIMKDFILKNFLIELGFNNNYRKIYICNVGHFRLEYQTQNDLHANSSAIYIFDYSNIKESLKQMINNPISFAHTETELIKYANISYMASLYDDGSIYRIADHQNSDMILSIIREIKLNKLLNEHENNF